MSTVKVVENNPLTFQTNLAPIFHPTILLFWSLIASASFLANEQSGLCSS